MKNEVYVLRPGELLPRQGSVYAPASVSLIKNIDEDILVDLGGLWDSFDDLNQWLKKYDSDIDNISMAVMTHNHPDHTELKGHFRLVYGSDSVYGKDDPHLYSPPIHVIKEIADGVTIIKTPGHESSQDQSVLADTDDGAVIIVGDLFLNEKEYRNPSDFSQWPPDNEAAAYQSRMKIIKGVKPKRVIPGHGPEFVV